MFEGLENYWFCLHFLYLYPHMPIDKVWIYRLLFFFCNFLLVCTDTDFSAVDKASSVIFYTVVNRRSWAGNLTFWGTLLQNRTNQIVCLLATTRLAQPEEVGPRVLWSRVGSACVDIRPYPKTDVLFHDFADKWKLQSSVLSCCSRVITPVTKLFWRTYKQFWNVVHCLLIGLLYSNVSF